MPTCTANIIHPLLKQSRNAKGYCISSQDRLNKLFLSRLQDIKCEVDKKCVLPGVLTVDVPPFAVEFCKASGFCAIVATADEDGFISLFNTTNYGKFTPIYRQRFHENAIFDISWVPQSYFLVTASGDQTAKLWDLNSGECVQTFNGHSCSLRTVCVSKFNTNMFASGSRDGNTLLWDTRNASPTARIQGSHVIQDYLTPMKKRRKMLPTDPGQLGKDSRQTVSSVVFRNEQTIITSGAMDGSIKLWDLRKTYKASKIPTPLEIISYPGQSTRRRGYTCLTISDHGDEIYASCTDDCIYKFNLSTRLSTPNNRWPTSRFYGHYNSSFYVRSCLSADGQYLLSGSDDNRAYIWKTSGNCETPVLRLHADDMAEVTAVAWSHCDPCSLVTCSDECVVRLWQLPTSKQPYEGTADVPNVQTKPPLQAKTPSKKVKSPFDSAKKQPGILSYHVKKKIKVDAENVSNKENIPIKLKVNSEVTQLPKSEALFSSPVRTPKQKIKKSTPISLDKWVIRTPPLRTDLSANIARSERKHSSLKRKSRVVKRLEISLPRSKNTLESPNKTIEAYFKLSQNK